MNEFISKDFFSRASYISKVEFWALTTIYFFSILYIATTISPDKVLFEEAGIPYHYYKHYFFPQLVQHTLYYLSFLILNFTMVPVLIHKKALRQSIFTVILLFLFTGFILGVTEIYTKNYLFSKFKENEAYSYFFTNSFLHTFWLLLLFFLYTVVKYCGLYLLNFTGPVPSKHKVVTRHGLTFLGLWLVSMCFLFIAKAEGEFFVLWGILIPCGIALYCYSFVSLIPKSLSKKNAFTAYTIRIFLWLFVSALPIVLLVQLIVYDEIAAVAITIINILFQLFFTVPLSWVQFQRHLEENKELYILKTELRHSNANLNFLRSQINPHFLFNSLNTLYGTALQGNNDRTAQGIQMLGDMMRFMLHENHQHKIPLSREIDYIRNYIELQSLRTCSSPNITIQTEIEDSLGEELIAPMLLIPFVENAFKHGICTDHSSWIKIMLHFEQNNLHFNVYNSIHTKQEQDPEKDRSGIGLGNVKQRLVLLYPGKHELTVRETTEEFSVHLSLQL